MVRAKRLAYNLISYTRGAQLSRSKVELERNAEIDAPLPPIEHREYALNNGVRTKLFDLLRNELHSLPSLCFYVLQNGNSESDGRASDLRPFPDLSPFNMRHRGVIKDVFTLSIHSIGTFLLAIFFE